MGGRLCLLASELAIILPLIAAARQRRYNLHLMAGTSYKLAPVWGRLRLLASELAIILTLIAAARQRRYNLRLMAGTSYKLAPVLGGGYGSLSGCAGASLA